MIWTPTTAMLWECWRLSRRGLGISITTATFVGWAVLSIESPAIYAMVFAAMFAWLGQGWAVVIDKRKRFTFAPGFTRPVATWKLALVPLAFVAIESAVSYLVPVSILGTAFGISFPLLPMAALCATISVTWTSFLWHASDLVVRRVMGIIVMIGWLWATPSVLSSGTPQIVSRIAPGEYAAMVFTCVVAFAMAVFGVARLRCGDDRIGLDWFASIRSGSAFHALFALYAKRITQGAVAVMLYTILIVTMVSRGWIAGDLISELHFGVLVAAVVIGMSFILWRGRAERVFSTPGVAFIVAIGLAFAIAANMVWTDPGGNSVGDHLIGLLIGLMPLSAMALAPWSFSRLRHR